MKMIGPERYSLTYGAEGLPTVLCSKGTSKFSGIAVSDKPKLYIASINDRPVYVGITKQPMRNRLRLGWNAKGESGYYGYKWREGGGQANLDIWAHDNAEGRNERDIETVEAEVVFLIRQQGQWPEFQTEIHFYPFAEVHRRVAAEIFQHYRSR